LIPKREYSEKCVTGVFACHSPGALAEGLWQAKLKFL